MSDVSHYFGNDLTLGANGDLLAVTGDTLTQQRILRRLMTNAGGYLWNLLYGAGLPARVGTKAIAAEIAGVVRSQIFQEAAVAQSPQPTIQVSATSGGQVTCTVSYTDAATSQPVTLTFPVIATAL